MPGGAQWDPSEGSWPLLMDRLRERHSPVRGCTPHLPGHIISLIGVTESSKPSCSSSLNTKYPDLPLL